RDVRPVRGERVDLLPLAHLEVLGQAPRVRLDRPRRPAQVGPDAQPGHGLLTAAQDGPLLLQDGHARQLLPHATTLSVGDITIGRQAPADGPGARPTPGTHADDRSNTYVAIDST